MTQPGIEPRSSRPLANTDHYANIRLCIYIVLFGPVKPELGVIPSRQEIIHE